MPKFAMLTFSNAVAGQEDDFNDWYNNCHLTEILAIPAFVGAQRFKQVDNMPGGPAGYLTLYEIETDDLSLTLAHLKEKSSTMTATPAIDRASVSMQFYEVLGDRQTE